MFAQGIAGKGRQLNCRLRSFNTSFYSTGKKHKAFSNEDPCTQMRTAVLTYISIIDTVSYADVHQSLHVYSVTRKVYHTPSNEFPSCFSRHGFFHAKSHNLTLHGYACMRYICFSLVCRRVWFRCASAYWPLLVQVSPGRMLTWKSHVETQNYIFHYQATKHMRKFSRRCADNYFNN